MPSKTLRTAFAVPFALAALMALPARSFAQDDGGAGEAAKPEVPAPARPKVEEPPPDVKGNRFRITLKSGAKIEGLLPQGVAWEKRDQLGEFVEAAETEKGAGLRLNYVLNMEGDIFIQKKDIEEVKDLGALTDEQKMVIKESILSTRKKNLEEREKINREELAKIAAASKADGAKGGEAEEAGDGGAKKDVEAEKRKARAAKAAKDAKRGDELLAKFPSETWGPKRIEEIQRNAVVNGIFPSADEQEFIDNIDLWKEAVARRDKEEAEKKDAEKKDAAKDAETDAEKGGEKGGAKEAPDGETVGGK